jgi:hypothetical protein
LIIWFILLAWSLLLPAGPADVATASGELSLAEPDDVATASGELSLAEPDDVATASGELSLPEPDELLFAEVLLLAVTGRMLTSAQALQE